MRRYGTLGVLALLVLGLFAYLRLDESVRRARTGPGNVQGKDLAAPEILLTLPVNPARGNLVHLLMQTRRPDGTIREVALRRYEVGGKGHFWLDSPHLRADDAAAEELFQALREAQVQRRLPGAAREAARYGVSAERFRVRLRLPGGLEVLFGDEAPGGPNGGLVYARRGDSPDVVLVSAQLYRLLAADREHFSSRYMTNQEVDIEAARRVQIGAVEVTAGTGTAAWVVKAPGRPAARASAARVAELKKTLRSARALRLLGGAGIPFRLDDYAVVPAPIVLKLDGIEQLFTGAPCPEPSEAKREVYLVRADAARMCFSKEDVARITPSYDDLLERRLLPMAPDRVHRVRLGEASVRRGPAGTFDIDGQPADPQAVRAFLDELAAARGEPDSVRPERGALATVEFEGEDGDRVRLALLRRERGFSVVRRDGERPLRTEARVAELLAGGTLRFRDRRLLSFPVAEVRRLLVERQDEQRRLVEEAVRESDGGPLGAAFRLRRPVVAPVDADLFVRVLGTLGELRVERLLSEAPRPAYGLDPPLLRFTISLGDSGQRQVDVGTSGKDGCHVRASTGSSVGLLGSAACRDLQTLLGDQRMLLVDDARRPQLGLVDAGAGPDHRARPVPVPQKALAGLLPLLHTLERGVVVGYGPAPRDAGTPLLLQLDQSPAPPGGGAAPAAEASVPPEHQELALYPSQGLLRVRGRDINYRPQPAAPPLRELWRGLRSAIAARP